MDGFEFGGRIKVKLPEIGLGTWKIGGSFTPDHSMDEQLAGIVGRAIDMGYSLIDTAEVYGSGNAEQIVGNALKGRNVFIATKVWQSNLKYDDVLGAAEGSMRRLGIKTVDLYQIHWPSDHVPLRETMRAMEKLVWDGKVKFIGVCNFDEHLLDDARSYLSREDIVTDQVSYSLLDRGPEDTLLDYCRKENIGIIAYEPLARKKVFGGMIGQALSTVAKKTGKTEAQVSLNWLICKGALPIPKSTDIRHLKENIGAAGWRLSEDDVMKLDKAAGETGPEYSGK